MKGRSISVRECRFDYWPWALKTLATSLLPVLFPATQLPQ